MSGNLVVISNDKIAFSRYMRKKNGLPTELSISSMLDANNGRFLIPLQQDGLVGLVGCKIDLVGSDHNLKGPQLISIYNNAASEHTVDGGIRSMPISVSGAGMYIRSDSLILESAATAASFIYDDIRVIYVEAMKAAELNIFPYYVGNIEDISKIMSDLRELNNTAKELDEDKTLDKDVKTTGLNTILDIYKHKVADLEQSFKLQKFYQ